MTLSDLLEALDEEVQDPEEGNIEIGRGDWPELIEHQNRSFYSHKLFRLKTSVSLTQKQTLWIYS